MKKEDVTIKEMLAAQARGFKVFITNAAPIPSDMFPVGSHPVLRIYSGRKEREWGTLVCEVNISVTDTGIRVPEYKISPISHPVTGQKMVANDLSYWVVRPDGLEQFTGFRADVVMDAPSLDSLLTKPEYEN